MFGDYHEKEQDLKNNCTLNTSEEGKKLKQQENQKDYTQKTVIWGF